MEQFIAYSLKSSVCLAAGFILFQLFLRRITFHTMKRYLLLGIILFSFIIPLIRLKSDPLPVIFRSGPRASVPAEKPIATVLTGKQKLLTIADMGTPGSNLVRTIYLLGASIQGLLLVFSVVRVLRLLRRSKRSLFSGIPVYLVRKPVVPFCFGRRIILSESDFNKGCEAIITHELTHIREFHFFDLAIAEMCRILTWYNPFAWLMAREIRQNHEFSADRAVLRKGLDASDYQLLLLKMAAGESRFRLASTFNQHPIKTRIMMMNKPQSNSKALLQALLFIPLAAMLVQVFAQRIVATPAGSGYTEQPARKYVELQEDQLKLLGFETNSTGLFYKNIRNGQPANGICCLYFTGTTFSASIMLRPGERIPGHSKPEKILKEMPLTQNTFYPVVVASPDGFRTLDMLPAEPDTLEKLLPVLVNMGSLSPGKRADTLVFWFKPTPELKAALSGIVKTEDYLVQCIPAKL
jgi:beta-lactamase regulating signal transducer with metallopeptidase domain